MLKDELRRLEDVVIAFPSEAHNEDVASIDPENGQEALITAECQRIKKVWTELLFSDAKDQVIKRYIWFQQQILLDLADKVYQQIQHSKQSASHSNYPIHTFSEFLLERLLDLKDFQIQYFNSYINQETKIPDAVIPSIRKRMSEAAEKLSASMQYVELDGQLKACIRDYLDGISATDISAVMNYRSAEYFFQFTETLSVTIAFEDSRDLTHSVVEALFYLNFNHNSFCLWYQENLIRKSLILGENDQLSLLKRELLLLKTMPVILTVSYDPELMPVNNLLENWLNEYIKEKNNQQNLMETDISDKIELKLTVAQLALLIRLLYEEGVFAMKNIAGLLRFFSKYFMSKKQEHISYGSMNKLYYSSDQFTGYAVRELLLKMVAKINKMFFPT
ncbi:hypothetical protein [Mucilaginibacter sp. L3T2-6]|uniref:hypothetical protein n=1 Tax=Mucilaginibacter sp. L3T2-6 TaxID=3062491 RepID=UPI0026769223|nr:hypothetical protein [Mucilaginibacter sp. L3T2-6]MDO3641528.1 hypothetical protein [Mucilaginibacter sp. L3T2-6]MDV6213711.1 hypothetical protein [Mucilaginibacter sp. L3T2-6]